MKVNVDFPDKVYSELDKLASRKSKSKAQVLRDAIALESWIDSVHQSGGKLLVERDGKISEVVIR